MQASSDRLEVYAHPCFSSDEKDTGVHDVALLRLASPGIVAGDGLQFPVVDEGIGFVDWKQKATAVQGGFAAVLHGCEDGR